MKLVRRWALLLILGLLSAVAFDGFHPLFYIPVAILISLAVGNLFNPDKE